MKKISKSIDFSPIKLELEIIINSTGDDIVYNVCAKKEGEFNVVDYIGRDLNEAVAAFSRELKLLTNLIVAKEKMKTKKGVLPMKEVKCEGCIWFKLNSLVCKRGHAIWFNTTKECTCDEYRSK